MAGTSPSQDIPKIDLTSVSLGLLWVLWLTALAVFALLLWLGAFTGEMVSLGYISILLGNVVLLVVVFPSKKSAQRFNYLGNKIFAFFEKLMTLVISVVFLGALVVAVIWFFGWLFSSSPPRPTIEDRVHDQVQDELDEFKSNCTVSGSVIICPND